MNNITVVGNAGRDAELRYTQSGRAVTGFSVADSRSFQVNNEWKEETIWWDCSVWGKSAEGAAERIKRGDPLTLIGTAGRDEFTNQAGQLQVKFTLNVFNWKDHAPKQEAPAPVYGPRTRD